MRVKRSTLARRALDRICSRLSMLVGFLENFMAGLGNVLARSFHGIAGRQYGRRTTEDDKHDEDHRQIATHDGSFPEPLHCINVCEPSKFPYPAICEAQ